MKPISALFFIFISVASFSQSLKLDGNFYCNGKAAMRTGGGISSAMAVQPDGKTLVGGRGGESIYDAGYCIVRFNANGTVDSSFGVNGKVITIYGGSIQSIIVLPDGKILAAGFLGNVLLVRYQHNGRLDSSFGTNGLMQPAFQNIRYSYCYSMKLQADGRIVLTGNVDGVAAMVARLMPDGSLDQSFAGTGYLYLPSVYIGFDAAVQPDGRIIIAGQGLGENDFMMARFWSNGLPDASFGNNGIVLTDMTQMSEYIRSISLLPDGRILAAGRYDYNSQYQNNFKTAVIRYNIDGSIDNSFGTNGIANLQFDDASADPKQLMMQPDGKILIAGDYTNIYTFHKPMLARFTSDGVIDADFGNNGSMVTTDFGDSLTCTAAAFLPDGKLVLSGYQMVQLDTTITYYTDSFFVMRYITNTILPVTFVNFSASKQQQSVMLNWLTENEINNKYFAVERSSGKNFSELGKVDANSKHGYFYADNNPLKGTNYYRLKQVDKDGNYAYSKIISIAFTDAGKFMVYPNPASDVLHIKGLNANTGYQFMIINEKGNEVAKASVNNISAYTFNVRNITSGFYYLKILSGNKVVATIKFVKQ